MLVRDEIVVDVRPLFAYNGWRRPGAVRGGHVPGAVAFPSSWLRTVEEDEVERLLAAKGIVPTKDVLVYGDRQDDVDAFRVRLASLGHTRVRTADLAAWTADLDRLPRYDKLVHPDWLWELLEGGRPEAAPAGSFRLFHVNFGVPEEYEEDHLPGAFYLDTNLLEDPASSRARHRA